MVKVWLVQEFRIERGTMYAQQRMANRRGDIGTLFCSVDLGASAGQG
jgi:hypothetical protein